jgi:hypothetical protein
VKLNATEKAALQLLSEVLGARVVEEEQPLFCQDCGAPGVGYAGPPDARGVFCTKHARWLPAAKWQSSDHRCQICGARYAYSFTIRNEKGDVWIRAYCPKHRPARTPGGRA